jgi:16S rRNA (guanine966-N2)-methyltransferase
MRVIGGEFRSRRLKTIPGLATRPTPDRLREALFNVLAPRIAGTVFLDAYAGTGAVGIEALSRGAARCIFLERSRRAVEAIRENLHALGIENRAQVVSGAALAKLAGQPADIAFLDPPYEMQAEYAAALGQVQAPLVIVQHSIRFDPGETHGVLKRTRLLKQGDNALSFYGSDLILTNLGNKDIHPEYKSELQQSPRLPSSPSPRVS